MLKKTIAIGLALVMVMSLAPVSITFAQEEFKEIPYSIGQLQVGSYEGYAHIVDIDFETLDDASDAGFYADENATKPITSGDAEIRNGKLFVKQGKNVHFITPADDSNGISRPEGQGNNTYSIIEYSLGTSTAIQGSWGYTISGSMNVHHNRTENGSVHYGARNSANSGEDYHLVSGVTTNSTSLYTLKFLQMPPASGRARYSTWMKQNPLSGGANNDYILIGANIDPGWSGVATHVRDIKIMSPNIENMTQTVHSISVYDEYEYLFRETIKEVEENLLGQNASLEEVKSGLNLSYNEVALDTGATSNQLRKGSVTWQAFHKDSGEDASDVIDLTTGELLTSDGEYNIVLKGNYRVENSDGSDSQKQKTIQYDVKIAQVNEADLAAQQLTWDKITTQNIDSVVENFTLPAEIDGATISWSVESGNQAATIDGTNFVITRSSSEDVTVSLKAVLSKGGSTAEVVFNMTVKRTLSIYTPSEGSITNLGKAVTNLPLETSEEISNSNNNLLYNIITQENPSGEAPTARVRSGANGHQNGVNDGNFYNLFDGKANTIGRTNMYISANFAVHNRQLAVGMDLGAEKLYNKMVIALDPSNIGYPQNSGQFSIVQIKVRAGNNTGSYQTARSGGNIYSAYTNNTNWPVIYDSGRLSNENALTNETLTIDFDRVVKSRYLAVEITLIGEQRTSARAANMPFDEWQLFLEDVKIDELNQNYNIDYAEKIMTFQNAETVGELMSSINLKEDMKATVFADEALTEPLSMDSNLEEGQWFATYYQAGERQIIQKYSIKGAMPAIRNLVIEGGADLDETLTLSYEFIQRDGTVVSMNHEDNISLFEWYADGEVVQAKSPKADYTIKLEDLGKEITVSATPLDAGGVEGIPVNNLPHSENVALKRAGNVLIGATDITVSSNQSTYSNASVVGKFLNGYRVDITSSGAVNQYYKFSGKLKEERFVNRLTLLTGGTGDLRKVTVRGRLGGGEWVVLYELSGVENLDQSKLYDRIPLSTPMLIDEFEVEMISDDQYTGGLSRFELYSVFTDEEIMDSIVAEAAIPSFVTNDFPLLNDGNLRAYAEITGWASDNDGIVVNSEQNYATINRTVEDVEVTLTLTVQRLGRTLTKDITVTVLKANPFEVSDMEFENSQGDVVDGIDNLPLDNKLTARATFTASKVYPNAEHTANGIIALYDKTTGKLISVASSEMVTVESDGIVDDVKEITVTLDYSAIQMPEHPEFKFMIWDNMQNAMPIAPIKKLTNDVVLSFAVISDVHIKDGDIDKDPTYSDPRNTITKFKTALERLKADYYDQDKLDTILISGDLTQDGLESEYNQFIATLTEVFPNSDVVGATGDNSLKILFVRGNHDNYPTSGANQGIGKTRYENILAPLGDYRHTGNYAVNIKGFDFVMLSQSNAAGNGAATALHDGATVSWFSSKMQEVTQNSGNKPVFVVTHPHIANTVYGSHKIQGGNYAGQSWGSEELAPTLTQYKQAIAFSGHSHYPIVDERSISQDRGFTAIGAGALVYTELDTGYAESFHPVRYGQHYYSESNGLFVEVKSNNAVEVTRLDFYRNELYKNGAKWHIQPMNDANWAVYTQSRDNIAPYFPSGTEVVVSDITSDNGKVTFGQAIDNDSDVDRYIIEYIDAEQNTTHTSRIIWSHHFSGSEMPRELYWTLGDGTDNTGDTSTLVGYSEKLMPGTTYKIKVTAVDSFGNQSEAVYSDEFSTLAE